jgi:hypothetical protein
VSKEYRKKSGSKQSVALICYKKVANASIFHELPSKMRKK